VKFCTFVTWEVARQQLRSCGRDSSDGGGNYKFLHLEGAHSVTFEVVIRLYVYKVQNFKDLMIKKLTSQDINQVAKLHRRQLPGFLSELGEEFLGKFYKVSLGIPEIFTLVEKRNGQMIAFACCAESAKDLYGKIIFRDILSFGMIFLRYFITHIKDSVKLVKTLSYPGFRDDIPELLTIAVKKEHQGKGIGRKLFTAAVEEFRKRGVEKFQISVYDRLPANKFYQKIGCKFERSFDFLGEKMNYYSYKIKQFSIFNFQ